MLPWKLWKSQILPVNQNLWLVYFSLAKFQLSSCNLSLAMIWQMTYTQKLPKQCSATLSLSLYWNRPFSQIHSFSIVHWEQTVNITYSSWITSYPYRSFMFLKNVFTKKLILRFRRHFAVSVWRQILAFWKDLK